MPADSDRPSSRLIRAARGEAPFDLLLEGGTVVDVVTGELRPADIGLVAGFIASVHPPGARADARERLTVAGGFVAPGLIDAHMHVESSMMTPRAYATVVVPQGTTAIVWDPHEVANVRGLDGVRWAIAASRDLPLRVLVLAPSCVPSAPGLERAGAAFDAGDARAMLAWPEIVGLAEVMNMRGVLEGAEPISGIVAAGVASRKLVCGHARGLDGADLQAFAAAGIGSDHEITSGDDLLAKLRAGFTVELRGSHPYVLPGAVEALRSLPRLPATLTLCTDDVFPDDLVERGGMIDLVRQLVRLGLPATDVLAAATHHAALRLGRSDLGIVAPGRRADLIVLRDLVDMAVEHVLADGRLVASGGLLREAPRPDPVPAPTDTMLLGPLAPDDLRPKAPGAPSGRVRLRSIVGARFTRWGEVEAEVDADGFVALPPGASLMAAIHRHGRGPAVPRLAILEDWGAWQGAIATTVSHDSHNLVVFGREPDAMAAAADAAVAAGGGVAVARGAEVLAVLPLPAFGLLSEAPPRAVADAFRAVREAADSVAEWKPPYRTFKACFGASLACNPGPHLTDLGLTDGGTGEVCDPSHAPSSPPQG